jgi:hypothetical protein
MDGQSGSSGARIAQAVRSPRRILEAELSWVSSLALFFATVYLVIKLDVIWAAFGVSALCLLVLPIIATRDVFKALPWEMAVILVAPVFLHISSAWDPAEGAPRWWNDLAAIAFSLSFATVGFLLTVELQLYTDVRMNRPFAVFFVFMFTVAAAGFWKVSEYVGGLVTGDPIVGGNADVMTFFLWTLAGGLLMGVVYDLYIKAMSDSRRRTLGFMHLYEVTGWRRD